MDADLFRTPRDRRTISSTIVIKAVAKNAQIEPSKPKLNKIANISPTQSDIMIRTIVLMRSSCDPTALFNGFLPYIYVGESRIACASNQLLHSCKSSTSNGYPRSSLYPLLPIQHRALLGSETLPPLAVAARSLKSVFEKLPPHDA